MQSTDPTNDPDLRALALAALPTPSLEASNALEVLADRLIELGVVHDRLEGYELDETRTVEKAIESGIPFTSFIHGEAEFSPLDYRKLIAIIGREALLRRTRAWAEGLFRRGLLEVEGLFEVEIVNLQVLERFRGPMAVAEYNVLDRPERLTQGFSYVRKMDEFAMHDSLLMHVGTLVDVGENMLTAARSLRWLAIRRIQTRSGKWYWHHDWFMAKPEKDDRGIWIRNASENALVQEYTAARRQNRFRVTQSST